jgi:hypothetical protein
MNFITGGCCINIQELSTRVRRCKFKSLLRDETSNGDKISNAFKCILSLVEQLSSEENN